MLHRLRFIAVLPLILTLLLAACGADEEAPSTPAGGGSVDPTATAEPSPTDVPDPTPSPSSTDLAGTSWKLVELDGEPPITDSHITITFEDGQASGSGGCNTYGADYVAGDESLSIEDLMITEMGCSEPEGVLEQEQAYVEALTQAASYRMDIPNNRLEIFDESGEVLIAFSNQDEPNGAEEPVGTEAPKGTEEPSGTGALDGTDWVLTHINSQEVEPDPPATLIFRNSQFTGLYGCLAYSGPVTTSSKGEILAMPVHSHGHECEGVVIPDMGETYMAALENVTQYRLTADRLDLLDEIGKIVLSYRPASTSQSGLDGTDWELIDLNGTPPIPDTEITLSFTNGSAGGNAGCNGYGSPYTVPVEGVISMPEIVSTAMGCPKPPGVEEQEMAYLQALYGVTGYRLTDNRLELTNEAGEVVLAYQPAGEAQSNLDGTSWDLVMMNGAQLVEGTAITLSFLDGWIDGSGGCNPYGGEYTASEGVISVPIVQADSAACPQPPGLMGQESTYHHVLATAATYRITDTTLELMNEASETILDYERQ